MSITIPSDWSIQDNQAKQQIASAGQKMLSGDDKNLQAIVKASELQSLNLFIIFEHPLGTPVPFNLNISCVAERVSHMPGIREGKDYHFHAKKKYWNQEKWTFHSQRKSTRKTSVELISTL